MPKPFLVRQIKTDRLYCSVYCLVENGGSIFNELERFDDLDEFNHFQDWEDQPDPQQRREECGSRWGYLCPVCERPYEDVLTTPPQPWKPNPGFQLPS